MYTNQPEDDKEGDSNRISVSLSGPIIPKKLGFRVYGSFNKTDMDAVDINPLVPYANANGSSYLARATGREGVENKDAGLRLAYQINPDHALIFDAAYGRQGNEYSGDTQYSNRDSSATTTGNRGPKQHLAKQPDWHRDEHHAPRQLFIDARRAV